MSETKRLPICKTFKVCQYNWHQICTNPDLSCQDRTDATIDVTINTGLKENPNE
jgi:hypothetical protein